MRRIVPARVRQGYAEHPVIATILTVLIVAAIVFAVVAIIAVVNKARRDEALDDEWDLDEEKDNEVYFYPNEEDFVEGE